MKKRILKIGHLYGLLMNTYGDNGNLIVLKKRAEDRGMEVVVKDITYRDVLQKGDYDLYFFGGGQDQAQSLIAKDLITNKRELVKEVERGVPLLSICGGYQLLGEYYKPSKGPKLGGLGVFQVYTEASNTRMIGNIVIESPFGKLVGFENHSGKTFLKEGAVPLGEVIKGFGNNGQDKYEGCMYKNAIGCYMHGSLLPKNPVLADWFLKKALEVKYEKGVELKVLDDTLELKAHDFAVAKFS